MECILVVLKFCLLRLFDKVYQEPSAVRATGNPGNGSNLISNCYPPLTAGPGDH